MIKHGIDKLDTCDPRLMELIYFVSKKWDIVISEGHRSKERQLELYKNKLTQVKHSKHNEFPSMAVDVEPHPVDWRTFGELLKAESKTEQLSIAKNIARWYMFIGYVNGVADKMQINIVSGGDWDDDTQITDNKFNDLVHHEIR